MFRKILITLLVIIVVLIGAMIAVPYLFKDQIVAEAKKTINEQVDAKVDFGGFSLSLFRSFPDFSFSINDVEVVNKKPFKGDTLARIGNFQFTLDLMSVIYSDQQINVKEIVLNDPTFNVIILEDGTANYNIMKSSEEADTTQQESAATYDVGLQYYAINNGDIIYDDRSGATYVHMQGLNHSGSGDFTQDNFVLNTETLIDKFLVQYGNVPYLNNVETELQADINVNMNKSKYTLKENKLRLNALELGLDGSVAMPDEAIKMDLFYEVQQSDFKNFISLLPNIYTESFEDVQTKGKLSLDGYVKGKYIDDHYPSFSLEVQVENGMFQYPDLPSSVNNVALNTSVKHPGGKLDQMKINMKRLYMELGGAPVEMSMKLTEPISDPYIDAEASGKLDLANVDKYYPLSEGQKLQGNLDANVAVKARMSDMDKGRYSRVDANGNLSLKGFNYKSPSLPNPVAIKTMAMSFTPRNVTLSKFNATIGESDLKMNGSIDNALGYALRGDMLEGSFSLSSNKFNANQFVSEEEGTETSEEETSADTGSYTVYEVPGNLDFVINGEFGKVIYGDNELRNVSGSIIIRDETLTLKNLRALVLDGQINMDASYSTKQSKTNPAINLSYNIRKLNIQKAYKQFNPVKKIAPMAKFFYGKFNSNMRLNGQMTENMGLKMETINGRGQVGIPNAEIRNFPAISKIANELNYNKANELKVRDVNASLRIENGRVHLEPVTVQQNNITTTVEGSHGLDQTLDYTAGTVIPRDELGAANDAVKSMVSSANIPGLQNAMPDNLAFDIGIDGPMNDPNISVSLNKSAMKGSAKDMAQEQVDQAKERAEEEVREAAEEAKDKAEEKAREAANKAKDKAKEEAQKAADEAKDKAKDEAEKAADKAGDKAKDEAKDQAEDAADEAEDKVNDIFDPS